MFEWSPPLTPPPPPISFSNRTQKSRISSDGLWNRSTWVPTQVTLLIPLSDKYSWERHEPIYPPSYRLDSTNIQLRARLGLIKIQANQYEFMVVKL